MSNTDKSPGTSPLSIEQRIDNNSSKTYIIQKDMGKMVEGLEVIHDTMEDIYLSQAALHFDEDIDAEDEIKFIDERVRDLQEQIRKLEIKFKAAVTHKTVHQEVLSLEMAVLEQMAFLAGNKGFMNIENKLDNIVPRMIKVIAAASVDVAKNATGKLNQAEEKMDHIISLLSVDDLFDASSDEDAEPLDRKKAGYPVWKPFYNMMPHIALQNKEGETSMQESRGTRSDFIMLAAEEKKAFNVTPLEQLHIMIKENSNVGQDQRINSAAHIDCTPLECLPAELGRRSCLRCDFSSLPEAPQTHPFNLDEELSLALQQWLQSHQVPWYRQLSGSNIAKFILWPCVVGFVNYAVLKA